MTLADRLERCPSSVTAHNHEMRRFTHTMLCTAVTESQNADIDCMFEYYSTDGSLNHPPLATSFLTLILSVDRELDMRAFGQLMTEGAYTRVNVLESRYHRVPDLTLLQASRILSWMAT